MGTWLKIAVRNLNKNRRRSLITALAIAMGFAAVNLFGGFTEYMYNGNREAAIYAKAQGHLTIFKKGFLEKGQLDRSAYLLTPDDMKIVKEVCGQTPHVVIATPQLTIKGLISNGTISTIFIAQGIVPSAVKAFSRKMSLINVLEYEGKELSDDNAYGVGVARGLARLLDLKVGSDAVTLATTVYGQTNALDVEVAQIFDVDTEVMNDKIMRVPLEFAQSLFDTEGVDRFSILLDGTEHTEPTRKRLRQAFAERGVEFEIRTWEEMSDWYRKVRDMFDVIFLFLFSIVFIIVVMSVVNTMGMAVLERTREIGTLRALGLKCRGVLLLFGIESTVLGILGTILGCFFTFVGWWWVDFYKPMWTPPGISKSVPLKIEFVPEFMFYSFLVLVALCLVASLIPARRGARQNVVDALGHV